MKVPQCGHHRTSKNFQINRQCMQQQIVTGMEKRNGILQVSERRYIVKYGGNFKQLYKQLLHGVRIIECMHDGSLNELFLMSTHTHVESIKSEMYLNNL
ncbi:hypothetical protein TNCV_73641 [Trichonephila clavipes]|nr:hypothetical protein TNCV_73641 [Trichonephila clavipes]